jgi:drug/metabolite transporter (DMT)-like permease
MLREATGPRRRAWRRLPATVGFGLALAIVLDTAIQLLAKLAISSLPPTSSLWEAAGHLIDQKIVLVLAILTVGQLVNWLRVLESAELSFALPITSLSYISVCGLSNVLFDERVGFLKLAGIVTVLAGVWCVSRTGKPAAREARGSA